MGRFVGFMGRFVGILGGSLEHSRVRWIIAFPSIHDQNLSIWIPDGQFTVIIVEHPQRFIGQRSRDRLVTHTIGEVYENSVAELTVCVDKGLMLKLKLQYFGHLMQRTNSLEKILMLGKI